MCATPDCSKAGATDPDRAGRAGELGGDRLGHLQPRRADAVVVGDQNAHDRPFGVRALLLGSRCSGVQRRRRAGRFTAVRGRVADGGAMEERMRLEGQEIAVVGAGIGGLAAATALAQRRARVRVFEQAPALGEVGAGIQVAPNGVAVLEALGLRDAAEAPREPAGGGRARRLPPRAPGRRRVPLGQAIVARHGRPYWHLHRADLLAVLARRRRRGGGRAPPRRRGRRRWSPTARGCAC